MSDAILADASSYLARLDTTGMFTHMGRHERADWIKENLIRLSKHSREQQIQCIAKVYATYALQQHDPALNLLIFQTAKTLAPGRNTQASMLRLLLELSISYSGSASPKEIKLEQNSYSRDVCAITNLITRGILPSQVLDLSRRPGEGLNAWARWKPEESTAPAAPSTKGDVDEPEGATKSADEIATEGEENGGASPPSVIGHELVWQKRLTDGSVVRIDSGELKSGELDQDLFNSIYDLIILPSLRLGAMIDGERKERAIPGPKKRVNVRVDQAAAAAQRRPRKVFA